MLSTLLLLASLGMHPMAMPQSGGPCGASAHCIVFTWTDTANPAKCNASSTPSCTLTYSLFAGTTSGGENYTTPVATGISSLTYTLPVTLTTNPQTGYYTLEAVITQGGITVTSAPSGEAGPITFPGVPNAPASPSAVPH